MSRVLIGGTKRLASARKVEGVRECCRQVRLFEHLSEAADFAYGPAHKRASGMPARDTLPVAADLPLPRCTTVRLLDVVLRQGRGLQPERQGTGGTRQIACPMKGIAGCRNSCVAALWNHFAAAAVKFH